MKKNVFKIHYLEKGKGNSFASKLVYLCFLSPICIRLGSCITSELPTPRPDPTYLLPDPGDRPPSRVI